MSESGYQRRVPPSRPFPLYKQHSWSPDIDREEAWLRRKAQSKIRRRSKSLTDDDLEELKACVELGFGFNSPVVDPRLCETFPALGFYHAVVNNHYNNHSISNSSSSSSASLCSSSSTHHSPAAIITHGENPETVKARLKQWAQVVACSARQS